MLIFRCRCCEMASESHSSLLSSGGGRESETRLVGGRIGRGRSGRREGMRSHANYPRFFPWPPLHMCARWVRERQGCCMHACMQVCVSACTHMHVDKEAREWERFALQGSKA